jgi:hypothetical protein
MTWLVWFDNNKINLTINVRVENIIEEQEGKFKIEMKKWSKMRDFQFIFSFYEEKFSFFSFFIVIISQFHFIRPSIKLFCLFLF